ncbi:MAG: hypothetical protein D3908_16565, partial [Candidatus Electrothrix sp. AUS4]|nr:hypothetical protein [Candidatus Electrothrix sp. AUS4]
DGKPSAGAIADEDDGITKNGTWSEGADGGTIDVTAYGAGWLVGWIDFNGDGSFSGTDEMIINQAFGTAGATFSDSISFDIPTGGLSSPGYARFRLFPEKPPVPKAAFKGIADNGEVEDYLFDLAPLSSIGDTILLDSDGDGVTDEPIVGAVVELQNKYCNAGVDCPTAVTDADGHYLFTGVGTGEYTVVVKEFPPTYTDTYNILYDPDATADGKTTINITEPGTVRLDADFWYTTAVTPLATGTIGDRIWNDADGDGVQDMGESGIGGVKVALKYSNGDPVYEADGTTPVTVTTDPDGSYMFTGVGSGDYKVEVDVTTLPAGVTQTGDPDGTKDHGTLVTLAAG